MVGSSSCNVDEVSKFNSVVCAAFRPIPYTKLVKDKLRTKLFAFEILIPCFCRSINVSKPLRTLLEQTLEIQMKKLLQRANEQQLWNSSSSSSSSSSCQPIIANRLDLLMRKLASSCFLIDLMCKNFWPNVSIIGGSIFGHNLHTGPPKHACWLPLR